MPSAKQEFLKNDCKKTKATNPDIYVPKLRETLKDKMLRKVETPSRANSASVPEKVIMMVGATGAGKTTMINGMFNYIVGVNWDDSFRMRLVEEETQEDQAKSQTSFITAYTLNRKPGFKIPFTLKVIDTPGFGDTGGIQRDHQITAMISDFFKAPGENGIDRLDAVGFVVPAGSPRLTPTQQYIFDSILKLFGKDIGDNIFMLFTFADGQKPNALEAVKAAGMPFQKYFKFNNSALFESDKTDTDEDDDGFNKMFWKMGMDSFCNLMIELDRLEPQSLSLTKAVLEERDRLQAAVEGIKENIDLSLNTLDELRKEREVLDKCKADMEKAKDFTYEEVVQVVEQIPTDFGRYGVNCTICNVTCHGSCAFSNDGDLARCSSMNVNGNCKRCPKNCKWTKHESKSFKLAFKTVKVQRTLGDLKQKYEEAAGKKMTAEQIVAECNKRIEQVMEETMKYVAKAKRCIARLDKIALKPATLTAVDYVDDLIVKEEEEAAPGWGSRVILLKELRKSAESLEDLPEDDADPTPPLPPIEVDPKKEKENEGKGIFGHVKRLWGKLF